MVNSSRNRQNFSFSVYNDLVRNFATSAQKRAMAKKQGKEGGVDEKDNSSSDTPSTSKISTPESAPAPPIAGVESPKSLIRTDFALDRSSANLQELILPSGYEIPHFSPRNTASSNTSNSAALQAQAVSYVDYKELYDPNMHLPSAPQDWTDYEPATPLWEELAAQIGVLGRPMTVAEFMQHALLHPKYGYYSQPMRNSVEDEDDDIFSDSDDDDDGGPIQVNPIFGPRGDFVTAPEICQVFGESIQVWMVTQWESMGKPKAIQWVEFGPGRGTLMADMVRFALSHKSTSGSDKLEEYGNALQVIHLIEPSRPLREKQQESLQEQLGDLVDWQFCNPTENTNDVDEVGVEPKLGDDNKPTNEKSMIHVHWHDSFASLTAMIMRRKQRNKGHESTVVDNHEPDISSMPLFVVCQEFFDALPVHAFELTDEGWRERMVDMAIRDEMLEDEVEANDKKESSPTPALSNPKNGTDGMKRPRLRIVLAPEVTPALKTLLNVDEDGKVTGDDLSSSNLQAKTGQVVEVCPEGILVVQDIASVLAEQGGAAIIVDYGEEGSTDSLRGFWKHKQTHFLSLPGQTDVTADVDFTALKYAVNQARPNRLRHFAEGDGNKADEEKDESKPVVKAYGPITQGKFLSSMGAQERVISFIEKDTTTDEEAENIFNALNRLVAPEEMGRRYKVLGITTERYKEAGSTRYSVPPPGF